MGGMFSNARDFNQDIGAWNVSNVTVMGGMFAVAESFNQDIGAWNVGNVTDMGGMFSNARDFNQDIEAWNVSNVTNMRSMFSSASGFNQPLNAWDVSLVTNMDNMFEDASSFNQYLGSWTSNAINRNNMFINSSMDCNNYSATLIGWETNTSANNVMLDSDGLQYSTHVTDVVNELVNNRSWTINGHTPSTGECRLFEIDAIANANVNENAVYTSVTPNLSGDTPIGNVTYTISGGADAADFTINGTTGVVSMVGRDFESPTDANTDNVYEIKITATDEDNNSDTETWTVTVIDDVIDNFSPPTGLSLSNQQINENEPAGTFIGILSAQDPDTGDSHTFSLLGTNASLFTIQDNSLKAAGPFNFEQQDVYTLTIQVEDAQGFTFSDQFEILVLNVNESPTEIILSNNTVNEEDIVIEVGILSTVDEDVADTHSYTILAGDHSSFFNIVDDRLIIDESLASDNGTQYTISVQSEDRGGLTITRDFVITVARKVHNEFNFPNAFTPNGDHENDTWEIPFLDLVDDCKVLIMDRDGNVVFESIGYDAPWDGTYGGNKLPKSTYFYIIRESRQGENKIHKGYVVIL